MTFILLIILGILLLPISVFVLEVLVALVMGAGALALWIILYAGLFVGWLVKKTIPIIKWYIREVKKV